MPSNPIKSLQVEPKVKRIIHELNFDFDHPHWAITSSSQGGAASGMNDPFLTKQNFSDEALSAEEQSILDELEEEFVPVRKSLSTDKNTPSTSGNPAEAVMAGDDNTNELGNKQDMSVKTDSQPTALEIENAELKKSLAVRDIQDSLSQYGLDKEVVKSLSEALVGHEQTIKPLVEGLIKSFQDQVVELEKAAKQVEPNEVFKALSKEEGFEATTKPKANDGSLLSKAKEYSQSNGAAK